jgi:hypothetical protein
MPVTIEIYDRSNQLVRRYSSTDQPHTIDPKSIDVPAAWLKTPQPPEASAGMHRFVWDLHWAPPTNEAPTRGSAAFFGGGGGPWALPGTYMVKLTANGRTYSQSVEVKMDPRVNTPIADLQRQFSIAQQTAGLLRQASQARQQATAVHQQLQRLRSQASGQSAASTAIEGVDRKLMDVIGQPRTAPGGFPEEPGNPNSFQAVTRSLQQVLQSVESADVAPTQGDLAALQQAQQNLTTTLARWNDFRNKDLQQLNSTLRQANLPSITVGAGEP